MTTNGTRRPRPAIYEGVQLPTWYEVDGTTGLDDLRLSADRCYDRTGQRQAIVRSSGLVELRPCPHDRPEPRVTDAGPVTVCGRCDQPLADVAPPPDVTVSRETQPEGEPAMSDVTSDESADRPVPGADVDETLVDEIPADGVDDAPVEPIDLRPGESACQRVYDGPLPDESDELARLLAEAFGEAVGETTDDLADPDDLAEDLAERIDRFRAAQYRLIELARTGR